MTLSDLCDLFYPLPNPWDTLEQRERHEHRDLPRMSRPELLHDRERLKLRLMLDERPDPWLFRRLERLREALGDAR